ncbi:dethiobiotin synthase [Deltaproteobacteria bacterium OttesenSCG-928-K17]|nr:dethiobiotin synthase [Deltaproteobacteria bacterium OttesenSCG-928-K17]
MNPPNACFILGSDTDVGKTLVAAGLLRLINGARALKPVQTGAQADETIYRQGCPRAEVKTLHRFQLAASPHLAAAGEGRHIDLDCLAEEIIREAGRAEFTLIEGAGGVYTPLNRVETYLDLMARLPFPALMVVRNALGAINHSLLSVNALRGAGLKVAGLVINQSSPPAAGQKLVLADNLKIIPALSKSRLLGVIPYLGPQAGEQTPAAWWLEIDKHLQAAAEHLLNECREPTTF